MAARSMIDRLKAGDVVVFVGAHPDDETTIGPLLAWAADRCRAVIVVSLTKGEAGWNLAREDRTRTLARVREEELAAAARKLRCVHVTFDYVNGVSRAHPEGLAVLELEADAVKRWRTQGDAKQTPEAIYERWTGECGDPAARLLQLFREKQATVVIGLEPQKGFTGHPEHIAASRAALKAAEAHSKTGGTGLSLYWAHKPSEDVADGQRIATQDLCRDGGKDYLGIARESSACYESQFGPPGSERSRRYVAEGVRQCLLRAADLRREPGCGGGPAGE